MIILFLQHQLSSCSATLLKKSTLSPFILLGNQPFNENKMASHSNVFPVLSWWNMPNLSCAYVANVRSRSKWKTCKFIPDLYQCRDERILNFRSAILEIWSEIRLSQYRSLWPWPLTFLKFDWSESCARFMVLLWWSLVTFWPVVLGISRIMPKAWNDLDLWPYQKLRFPRLRNDVTCTHLINHLSMCSRSHEIMLKSFKCGIPSLSCRPSRQCQVKVNMVDIPV